MKKKLFLTCLALACSALMFSCDRNGSDDPDNSDNPGGNGTTGQIVSNAVTDIDGNHYDAVWIDGKLWMKDNLKTTKFADGTPIELDGESGWTDEVLRFYPNDDASTVGTYGYLYDWYAVMHGNASSAANPSGVQGICPDGWHVPSKAEWAQMLDYLCSHNQYQCGAFNNNIAKSLASTTGWESSTNPCAVGNDQSSNNSSGFSAYPAGIYHAGPLGFGLRADFWSSTEDGDRAIAQDLQFNSAAVTTDSKNKTLGFSVRCVRD